MIVYTVICRAKDAAILVDFASEELSGNAPQVTCSLLEALRDNPTIMEEGLLKTFVHRNYDDGPEDFSFNTFMQACTVPITTTEELDLGMIQEHYFHLWYQDGVYYCCLSDDPDPRYHKVAFAFLQAVARDFSQKFSSRKIKNCDAYALNKDFTPNLRSAMHYYNINREILSRDDKINTLLSQVDDMKAVLGRNIQLMLGRGEKVDRLLAKSEQTMKDVMVFKKKSDKLKKLERLRSIKLTSIVIGMVLGITIIASVASKNA